MRFLIAFLLLCSTLLADTVKIGIILPLSGNNSHLGLPQLKALKLFQSELAKRPLKHKYEFIVEDDQCAAKLTVEAARKLIHVDKVSALVSLVSGPGIAIAPITEQNKILHFCLASDEKVAKGEYNFSHWIRAQPEAPLLAEYLKAKGIKTVGIITVRQQACTACAEEFKKIFPKYGIKIVDEQIFIPGERDFRPLLMKLPNPLPDALIPMALEPEMDILMRQMKQSGLMEKSLITSMQSYDLIIEKSLIEGSIYVSAAPPTKEFYDKFVTFNKEDPDFINPYFYDILGLEVEALESCSSPNTDRTPALAYLNKVKDHPSAIGLMSIDTEGLVHSSASLYKTVQGKRKPVSLAEALAK